MPTAAKPVYSPDVVCEVIVYPPNHTQWELDRRGFTSAEAAVEYVKFESNRKDKMERAFVIDFGISENAKAKKLLTALLVFIAVVAIMCLIVHAWFGLISSIFAAAEVVREIREWGQPEG